MHGFLGTVAYSVLGLFLMFLGYKFFDMITPYNFAEEIKEKNPAIGIVIVGLFISIAMIVRAAIV
ncbi:MAG: DUF350 domain-containing protein [Clostridium sp.]|uniref:DUF350 domain-containing protein n=1 Tax=Clostridium TaxID=1485 RepID=UPI002152209A|nr:DUF350 domain-containing protein [Clostridium sp. LY3-2]MCR6516200.1 DUF350 domain-containing protein [Clostridium sp. LY3-2]